MITKNVLSPIILNDLFRDLDLVNNYTLAPNEYTEYFKNETGSRIIGNYNLYFKKKPNYQKYLNQIFRKLSGYSAHDALKYIRYHYEYFPNKIEFLEFIICELTVRSQCITSPIFFYKTFKRKEKVIYKICLKFAEDEMERIKIENKKIIYNTFLKNEMGLMINKHLKDNGINNNQEDTNELKITLAKTINHMLEITEMKLSDICNKTNTSQTLVMEEMKKEFVTANIKTEGIEARNTFIISMILLGDLYKNEELVFGDMVDIDIAKILKLNFNYYKTKALKVETIAGEVAKVRSKLYNDNKNKTKIDTEFKKMINMYSA